MKKVNTKQENEPHLKFIRVGDDYYKITFRPDKNGKLHRILAKRLKTTIKDDYGPKIIDKIPKYEDFAIVPSHTEYQQVIHGHYNEYYELTHQPKKGPIDATLAFLTHIFGKDYLNFALDYFQLLYLKPTQNLPIILLESQERNTGKSTFGHFLEKIFQFNSVSLGNKDFESEFNSAWLNKLLIVVDEASLEKKAIMEMIKKLSTEKGRILMNAKGKDKKEIDFFGKFIFMANDEGTALPIQRGEKRFAVFKVPTFTNNGINENTNMLEDLVKEIPAFLDYLRNRKIVHEHQGRMYFHESVYFTEQLQLYFNNSLGYVAKSIKQLIQDTFAMFPDETELCFSPGNLLVELGNYAKYIDKTKVKEAVEKELSLTLNRKGRYTYHSLQQAENTESYYPSYNSQNNVYYVFERSRFWGQSLESTNEVFSEAEQTPIF